MDDPQRQQPPPEPGDTGEPHDVLAADEFPIPAEPDTPPSGAAPLGAARALGLGAVVGALAAVLLRRRRR